MRPNSCAGQRAESPWGLAHSGDCASLLHACGCGYFSNDLTVFPHVADASILLRMQRRCKKHMSSMHGEEPAVVSDVCQDRAEGFSAVHLCSARVCEVLQGWRCQGVAIP